MIDPAGMTALGTRMGLGDRPVRKPEEAVRQFEALLLGQVLKSARTGLGLDGEEDPTASSLRDMADEHFAATLAAQGGLGLSRLLMQGLAEPKPCSPESNEPLRTERTSRPAVPGSYDR